VDDDELIGGIPGGGIPIALETETIKVSRQLEKTHYIVFYTMNGCTNWNSTCIQDDEASCIEELRAFTGVEKMRLVRVSLPVSTPEGAVFV